MVAHELLDHAVQKPGRDPDFHQGRDVVEGHRGQPARRPHRRKVGWTVDRHGPAGTGLVDMLLSFVLHYVDRHAGAAASARPTASGLRISGGSRVVRPGNPG
jgi:hypothetical protein